MKLTGVRDAMVSTLAARYPALKVESHGGQFTEKEVALLLGKAPALLVGCLGFPALEPFIDQWKGAATWAVYVFAADTATNARDVLALDIVQDLMTWLPDQRWGIGEADFVDRESLTADNLYTGHVNILRVSLWAVTWSQTFLLSKV